MRVKPILQALTNNIYFWVLIFVLSVYFSKDKAGCFL